MVESLRKVIFYGSYAKRDFNEESDIDILLMVSGGENLNIEDEELAEISDPKTITVK